MDDISRKREALFAAYNNSPRWRKKVLAMSDTQVIAVYLRLQKQNKL